MAKNNLILSGSVKILFAWLCRVSLCLRVLWQARRRASEAVAETITIVLEHFTGNELKRFHNLPFYADVTYFSFGSCTQRRPLFLFFIVFFKRCGKCCKCQNCTFGNLDLKWVDGSHLLVYSNVLHVLIQEQS